MAHNDFRDHLLVTMGARAAYMHMDNRIEFATDLEGEVELSTFVAKIVDAYLLDYCTSDENFDEFIERALIAEYGVDD